MASVRTMHTLGRRSIRLFAVVKFYEEYFHIFFLSVSEMANTDRFPIDCVQF